MEEKLKDTGERFLPETAASEYESFWYYRQLFGYQYASSEIILAGDKVLEVGSGEGYGAAVLAGKAAAVTGLDKNPDAAAHAAVKYRRDNLEYLSYDGLALPFPDASFDKVVSLHCIEHIPDDAFFLSEVSRVLKPGGCLVVSTPNKAYRVQPTRWYKFHVREYTAAEFQTLLGSAFPKVSLRYLRCPNKFFDMELKLTRTGNLIQRMDPLNLYARVPNAVKQAFFRVFSLLNHGRGGPPQAAVSTADFSVTDADERGLDLIAVCRKS